MTLLIPQSGKRKEEWIEVRGIIYRNRQTKLIVSSRGGGRS